MRWLWSASRVVARDARAGDLATFTRLYAAAGKKGKGAKAGTKGVKEELAPFLPLILKPDALGKPKKIKAQFTKEELADAERRSKEYSRNKNKQHLEWRRDMEGKFKCKEEAFEALPEVLQGPASVPDLEPFPMIRRIPTDYPPSVWPL